MGILDRFSAGWGKGFSREAGRVLEGAVELAGNYGCDRADTGHLLLAILQQDHGPAGRFLAGKNIREQEVRRQLAEGRQGTPRRLRRQDLAPELRRAIDYALIDAQNARQPRAEPEHLLCAMMEDGGCTAGVMLASMGLQLSEAVRECPDVGTADPAGAAPGGVRRAQGQPRQRQILPGPDPPRRRRGTGPRLLPGQGAGPDDRDPLPAAEE